MTIPAKGCQAAGTDAMVARPSDDDRVPITISPELQLPRRRGAPPSKRYRTRAPLLTAVRNHTSSSSEPAANPRKLRCQTIARPHARPQKYTDCRKRAPIGPSRRRHGSRDPRRPYRRRCEDRQKRTTFVTPNSRTKRWTTAGRAVCRRWRRSCSCCASARAQPPGDAQVEWLGATSGEPGLIEGRASESAPAL
jgi:hypothetical protein